MLLKMFFRIFFSLFFLVIFALSASNFFHKDSSTSVLRASSFDFESSFLTWFKGGDSKKISLENENKKDPFFQLIHLHKKFLTDRFNDKQFQNTLFKQFQILNLDFSKNFFTHFPFLEENQFLNFIKNASHNPRSSFQMYYSKYYSVNGKHYAVSYHLKNDLNSGQFHIIRETDNNGQKYKSFYKYFPGNKNSKSLKSPFLEVDDLFNKKPLNKKKTYFI